MGRTSAAPRQLPMAPRPLKGELVSSWLSRVAAANCISLEELLDALSLVNRWSRCPSECLDMNLDPVMRLALSDFCRVPSEFVSQLTLERQFPGVPKEMFLSFPNFFGVSGCPMTSRVGYAFCPDCLHEAARTGDPCYISCRVELGSADALPRSFATASLALPRLPRRRAAALSEPSEIRLLLSKLWLRLFRKVDPGETSSPNKCCDGT